MIKYELVLINEKERSYRLISLLLLTINFLSILFLTYSKGFNKWGPLVFALLAAFSVFAGYYFKNKNEKIIFNVAFLFFFFAWLTLGFTAIGILNAALGLLSAFALSKTIVRITDNNIVFPSSFNRTIPWNELSNVILKDDLLTIDFKNNKLIQQLIDKNFPSVNEKEFNDFCRQQLNK